MWEFIQIVLKLNIAITRFKSDHYWKTKNELCEKSIIPNIAYKLKPFRILILPPFTLFSWLVYQSPLQAIENGSFARISRKKKN